MKDFILIVFSVSVLLISCTEKKATQILEPSISIDDTLLQIPDTTVNKSALEYNNKKSLWKLDSKLYSGYAISFHQNGALKEKIGFLDGKKQNQTTHWFSNGYVRLSANYYKGKLHGEKKVWLSDTNHVLISHFNYQLGKPHGEQIQWYPTGELHKKMSLYEGREKGIQQGFRKNGALYANYEVKEGRIFGMKKASLCFSLENENIQYEK